jgi:hypothetical protein
MNLEARIAFIQSQVVCAQGEIEGMKAMNAARESQGYALAYDDGAFFSVAGKYGLEQNQVLNYLGE